MGRVKNCANVLQAGVFAARAANLFGFPLSLGILILASSLTLPFACGQLEELPKFAINWMRRAPYAMAIV